MRILVVEDHAANAQLFALMLKSVADVDIAATYNEAVAKTQSNSYDLFLVDIQLGPGAKTGIDFLYALRSELEVPSTPVVACTGSVHPDEVHSYMKHGFDECLSKPFTKKDLLGLVHAFVS